MRLGDSPMEYVVVANAVPMPTDPPASQEPEFSLWDGGEFDFGDILDVVNPLQHIPVVSSIYRELTGDEIGPAPRIMGGALFGGIVGAVASLVNVLVEDGTGKDLGEHAIALVFGDDEAPAPADQPMLAETGPLHDFPVESEAIVAAPAAGARSKAPDLAQSQSLYERRTDEPMISALRPAGAPLEQTSRKTGPQSLEDDPDAVPHEDQSALADRVAVEMMGALDKYRNMMREPVLSEPVFDIHT